jgi:FtsP/CotA-like multicopper oxidase with cupredoxin domain
MADMGMDHGGMDHGGMSGMDHGAMNGGAMSGDAMHHGDMKTGDAGATHVMPGGAEMAGAAHDGMKADGAHVMPDGRMMGGASHEAMDHGATAGMDHGGDADPFYAPGSGLTPEAANGGDFLSYADLKARKPLYPDRAPTREIELRLTGNMERYTWSINGVKYEDAEPIRLQYGERVRFKFVNETMMAHPMHLHGMWSILDNGSGELNPIKHVISVAPGTTVYMETEVDAPGQWAFHCHLAYHADAGMFRKVIVEGGPSEQETAFSAVRGE